MGQLKSGLSTSGYRVGRHRMHGRQWLRKKLGRLLVGDESPGALVAS